MNKQIMRTVGLVSAVLFIIGFASYALVGIHAPEAEAEYNPSNPFDLFKDHLTWPSSAAKKTGTAAEWLHAMKNDVSTGGAVSHIDINGDGLVDILVHEEPGSSGTFYYGIFLNQGDLTFDLVYKCVFKTGVYYGDCAQ